MRKLSPVAMNSEYFDRYSQERLFYLEKKQKEAKEECHKGNSITNIYTYTNSHH